MKQLSKERCIYLNFLKFKLKKIKIETWKDLLKKLKLKIKELCQFKKLILLVAALVFQLKQIFNYPSHVQWHAYFL